MSFMCKFTHILTSLLILSFASVMFGCAVGTGVGDFDADGTVDTEDCGPADPLVYPGAADPYGDDIDQNCDGEDGLASDMDGDSFASRVDCDDRNPYVNPAADDPIGDGIDQNCDGIDGVAVDLDQDSFSNAVDCDDSDPLINPGAAEIGGDSRDENCDGLDDPPEDVDGDGFENHLDCDDTDPTITTCPEETVPVVETVTVPVSDLACTEVLFYDPDVVDATGLSFYSSNQNSGWLLSGIDGQAYSGIRSLYYGNPATQTYDYGESRGTLTINPISTNGGTNLKLKFWLWADIGTEVFTDIFCVRTGSSNEVGVNPYLEQQCLNSTYDFTSGPTWQEQTLYFAGTGGEDAAVEFVFDTINEFDNTGEGIYLDDIRLYDCAP